MAQAQQDILTTQLEKINSQLLHDLRRPHHGRTERVRVNAHALRCTCDDFYAKSGADFSSIK